MILPRGIGVTAAVRRRPPLFTGLSRQHLAELTVELAEPWTAAHESAPDQRRGHPRQRAAGAGPTTAWAW